MKLNPEDPNIHEAFENHCLDGWSSRSFAAKIKGGMDVFLLICRTDPKFKAIADKYDRRKSRLHNTFYGKLTGEFIQQDAVSQHGRDHSNSLLPGAVTQEMANPRAQAMKSILAELVQAPNDTKSQDTNSATLESERRCRELHSNYVRIASIQPWWRDVDIGRFGPLGHAPHNLCEPQDVWSEIQQTKPKDQD
jgi:hypothetical protein